MTTKKVEWTFKILGMTCVSCSNRAEKALKKIPSVSFATVNLATESAYVVSNDEVTWEILRNAVQKAGYDISREMDHASDTKRWEKNKINLFWALLVTIPLTIWMLIHMSSSGHHGASMSYLIFELLASTFVIFVTGRQTLRSAWIALKHSHANMDTLISLGAISSWATAVIYFGAFQGWISLDILSFGAIGAMIMGLHLTGRAIESWLRDRAAREIKALIEMKSSMARWISDEGEILLPVEAVKVGWKLQVYAGERIALDGRVIKGQSAVDESMISGEAIPVEKVPGDDLTGGSINLSGAMTYEVSHTGEDTFLSQMIRLVKEAQGTKVPIQALADKITTWFVPIVLLLALISGLFWFFMFDALQGFYVASRSFLPWILDTTHPFSFALFVFVATLVIACPCALGLATPMALIKGTGLAAKRGILIRNGEAIQTSTAIQVVLLDKTGTLTMGTPKIAQISLPEEEWPVIASLERKSHHPLAKAVSQLDTTELALTEVMEIAGSGIQARRFMDTYFAGKALDPLRYETFYQSGQSVVECRKNDEVIGFVVLEDPLREESAKVIAWMKSRGILPVMVTGDHQLTAQRIAKQTGIDQIYAQVLPQDKLEIVRKFQSKGMKVMMIGDGINDAAALKGADIGVAVGSGTDLAMDSADMILIRDGIGGIRDLMAISRATFHIIRQNLFWAFWYNLLAIPASMMGWLHPVIAEAAMAMSSISVILNSMRISRLSNKSKSISVPADHLVEIRDYLSEEGRNTVESA
jgi:P-type Cu+ transporter